MAKYIELTQGKRAIVDDEDYGWLSQHSWCAHRVTKKGGANWYAIRYVKEQGRLSKVHMHRTILSAPTGMDVDHINRDSLDNRRMNLRVCTHAENMRNRASSCGSSSMYLGVYRDTRRAKWRAQLAQNGKMYCLGRYDTESDAARAYDAKAREVHGEFANLNFP